ncbi:MAG TPA: hypothetical protein VMH33_01600 [Solirubrobacterales bacterium]|nr:hypothetical protein [Solirubrobacterales bacterium]
MSDDVRSAEARARAEQALVWLVSGFDGAEIDLIVLGGLVPEILTRGVEPGSSMGHLGTTDVDLLLITRVDQDEDLGAVEASLTKLDFEPEENGWRWRGTVADRRVKIEFLCDLETVREQELVEPVGCKNLRALNLRGTGYVAKDWQYEELHAPGPDGEPLTVKVRFAGLRGYLLSKLVAARTRGKDKDYYDLAYVLIHNREGGPRQAAELLLAGEFRAAVVDLRATLEEIAARFRSPTDFAAQSYSEQMRLVDPELDDATLRTDATVAIAEFLEILLTGAE